MMFTTCPSWLYKAMTIVLASIGCLLLGLTISSGLATYNHNNPDASTASYVAETVTRELYNGNSEPMMDILYVKSKEHRQALPIVRERIDALANNMAKSIAYKHKGVYEVKTVSVNSNNRRNRYAVNMKVLFNDGTIRNSNIDLIWVASEGRFFLNTGRYR